MIQWISVNNFKAFIRAEAPLGALSLFTGINGSGKSTFIQSLLLLRQSFLAFQLPEKGLLLKGDVLIGKGEDASHYLSTSDRIVFELEFGKDTSYRFSFERKGGELLKLIKEDSAVGSREELAEYPLFNNSFQYLGAERLAPRAIFPYDEEHVKNNRSLGYQGEFTPHFIAEYGFENLQIPSLKHPEAVLSTLLENIEKWLGDMSGSVRVTASLIPNVDNVRLAYQLRAGAGWTDEFSSVNVGFGYTYVLPVVTAVLAAKPGDLLIIENPESHLHPRGQAKLGELFAIAANAGVQIIVESHSDHIFNSIRVAVKKGVISHHDVGLFYFERDPGEELHQAKIVRPNLDKNGRVDSYPSGFFDEFSNQLDLLLD